MPHEFTAQLARTVRVACTCAALYSRPVMSLQSHVRNRWRFYLPLILFTAAILAIIWGVMLQAVMQDRRNEQKAWLSHTANLARLLEGQTESTLDYVDAVLWQLKVQYERQGNTQNLEQLFRFVNNKAGLVIGLAIANSRGELIFTTVPGPKAVNIADRPHFQVHVARDSNKLVLSPPIHSRTADKAALVATRRINNADGSFAGVVALLLHPHYFTQRYADVDLGDHRTVILAGTDGVVRSRLSGGKFDTGQNFAETSIFKQAQSVREGSHFGVSTLDGVRRAVSFRVLQGHPLMVAVGVSEDKVYESHHERRRELMISAGAATLFVLLIAGVMSALLLRATRAEAALPESEARLRMATDAANMTNWEWDIGDEHVRWGEGQEHLLGPRPGGNGHYPDFRQMVHEDDRERYLAAGRAAMDHDAPYEIEFRLVGTDGVTRWLRTIGTVIRDASGKAIRMAGVTQNISRQREAAQALAESNEKFAALINSIPVPAWHKDKNLRYVSVNRAWCQRHNTALKDAIGKATNDLFPAEFSRQRDDEDRMVISSGVQQVFERKDTIDGQDRWIEMHKAPVFDDKGAVTGLVGISQDITLHKKAEGELHQMNEVLERIAAERNRALADSEMRFTQVAEATGVYVWELDRNKRYTYASAWVEQLFGYATDEMLGHTPDEFMPPGEAERVAAWIKANTREDGSFLGLEHRSVHKTGRIFWQLVHCYPVRSENGDVIAQRGTGVDITERKTAEEALRASEDRYRDLVENSLDVICTHDLEGRLLSVNEEMVRVLGYSRESLLGRNIADLLTPQYVGRIPQYLELIRTRGHVESVMAMTAANGDVRYFDLRNSLRATGVEQPVARCIARDITDKRRAELAAADTEKQRRELELQLQQSQKLKAIGTLAGGIAHDFNNILPAIFGNIELAREELSIEHPAREPLDEIQKASTRAKELVQRILAFSTARTHERKNEISLEPVIQEAVKMLSVAMPAGMRIDTQVEPHLPMVKADSTQIHQIMVNLCTNAWHAMTGKPGVVSVRLEKASVAPMQTQGTGGMAPGDYVRLTVSDTGKGMDEDTLRHIFDPFFTTRPMGQGTGLGLSIVHGIVREHGATIHVRSTPGQGASFIVHFPVAAAAPDAPGRELSTLTPRDFRRAAGKIAYIDDDEALTLLTARSLRRAGYDTTGYVDAAEAVAAIRDKPNDVDIVITDYRMPGMSGLDVVRQLRKINPALTVVIISGYVTDDLHRAAVELGVEVMTKPDTISALIPAIERLLERIRPEAVARNNTV